MREVAGAIRAAITVATSKEMRRRSMTGLASGGSRFATTSTYWKPRNCPKANRQARLPFGNQLGCGAGRHAQRLPLPEIMAEDDPGVLTRRDLTQSLDAGTRRRHIPHLSELVG